MTDAPPTPLDQLPGLVVVAEFEVMDEKGHVMCWGWRVRAEEEAKDERP